MNKIKIIYSNLCCFLFFILIIFINNIEIKNNFNNDIKIIRLSWNIKNKIINKCKENKLEIKNSHMKKRNCKNLIEKQSKLTIFLNDLKKIEKKIINNKTGNSIIITDLLINCKKKKEIKLKLKLKNKKNKIKKIKKIILFKNKQILLLSYEKNNKKLFLK